MKQYRVFKKCVYVFSVVQLHSDQALLLIKIHSPILLCARLRYLHNVQQFGVLLHPNKQWSMQLLEDTYHSIRKFNCRDAEIESFSICTTNVLITVVHRQQL